MVRQLNVSFICYWLVTRTGELLNINRTLCGLGKYFERLFWQIYAQNEPRFLGISWITFFTTMSPPSTLQHVWSSMFWIVFVKIQMKSAWERIINEGEKLILVKAVLRARVYECSQEQLLMSLPLNLSESSVKTVSHWKAKPCTQWCNCEKQEPSTCT